MRQHKLYELLLTWGIPLYWDTLHNKYYS